VLADKAYSSRANREYLRQRGITATIPIKVDQAENRRKKGRRADAHRHPSPRSTSVVTLWSVASTGSNATETRATRYEKLAVRNLATLHVVAITNGYDPAYETGPRWTSRIRGSMWGAHG
jgi:hypothetical protein